VRAYSRRKIEAAVVCGVVATSDSHSDALRSVRVRVRIR
jgi:hypothetical protein